MSNNLLYLIVAGSILTTGCASTQIPSVYDMPHRKEVGKLSIKDAEETTNRMIYGPGAGARYRAYIRQKKAKDLSPFEELLESIRKQQEEQQEYFHHF